MMLFDTNIRDYEFKNPYSNGIDKFSIPSYNHGKTEVQKRKAAAKRHKKNKNKKTHRK